MSEVPAMPLWWADYWTKTRRLSPTEHHAYLFLLGATWMNNCKPFPDDDRVLAAEIGISVASWRRVRPAIVRFFDISDGTWRNRRLEQEFSFVLQRVKKNRTNGERGGRPKKNMPAEKTQRNQLSGKPNGFHIENPNVTQPITQTKAPTPIPIDSASNEAVARATPEDSIKAVFDVGVRLLVGCGVREAAARSLIGKHRKTLHDDGRLLAILLSVEKQGPVDAIGYIEKAVQRAANNGITPFGSPGFA